ncbi:hypothetical protein J2I47_14145 [Fibrella sp. HMF5335]|uniref:Uncharacterized protein n=1 Tax=Fibrella rubiginis TaxID=2817060 RepID=A0A939GJ28_9BACT|nr:hypothetical protein [Fibrella rubiginis]MBO0937695.1 hypothetical protein [Fibrella rubiginis]
MVICSYVDVLGYKSRAAILLVDQDYIDGTAGETFSNRITLLNDTDEASILRLILKAPPAFRLLTQLPATMTLAPHSSRQLLLKFMIERTWNGEEGIVRIETSQHDPTAGSAVQFIVTPNRNAPSTLLFSLLDEAPFVAPNQDTLRVPVRFSNQGPHARNLRVRLFSMPAGFRLPHSFLPISIPARRDTTLYLPCLVGRALERDRRYDLTIEAQEVNETGLLGSFLGSVACRPVLLATSKHWADRSLLGGENPFGVAVGVGRFGRAGIVNEFRTWGHKELGKGRLDFKLYYLNYADLNYHELRDTYIQYEQKGFELHAGSIYDYHELPLIGVGLRVAGTFGEATRLEGWALRNQSNWLAALMPSTLGQFQSTQPVADQTYSMRLSGTLPLSGDARYEFSSSYYQQQRLERAGTLSYAAAHWQLNPHSTIKLRVGNSFDFAPGHPQRERLMGWAGGGSYSLHTKPLDVYASAYVSSPVYGGIQRGATLLEHSLTLKKWANTRLSYRYSQIQYNQQIFTSISEMGNRRYGNTLAEVYWVQQFGRVTSIVRPYFWLQSQSLPDGLNQQANAYRLQATLRYEARSGARVEVGVDAGQFDHVTPPTDQFRVGSFRYYGSVGRGNLNLMGLYQQGPFLINDYLPGQGDPGGYRQFSVGPTAQFSLLNGRLRGSLGASLNYNSMASSWNGLLYNSMTFAANETMRIRFDVNALSYANQFADMSTVPWQESQMRVEVAKTFRRLPGQSSRTLRLRFFDDENNNQKRDGNEQYSQDLVVNVGRLAMITDKKGLIICKDLPNGTYPVRAVCRLSTGEPVWYQDTVQITGSSVSRDMAIQKTWRIAGTLRCNRVKYDTQPCGLDQYRIETTGIAGELYRTYADEQGQFTLYLPIGQYQVAVTQAQSPASRKLVTYTVEPKGQATPLSIELDPSGRPVQIRRFTKL